MAPRPCPGDGRLIHPVRIMRWAWGRISVTVRQPTCHPKRLCPWQNECQRPPRGMINGMYGSPRTRSGWRWALWDQRQVGVKNQNPIQPVSCLSISLGGWLRDAQETCFIADSLFPANLDRVVQAGCPPCGMGGMPCKVGIRGRQNCVHGPAASPSENFFTARLKLMRFRTLSGGHAKRGPKTRTIKSSRCCRP